MDLSEFSFVYPFPAVIEFVGYASNGNIVTTEFTTDGIFYGTGAANDFETFYFNKEFSDLVRFEVPSYGFALDNLVFFDVIPEPGVGALLALGAGSIFVGLRCRKSKCRRTVCRALRSSQSEIHD